MKFRNNPLSVEEVKNLDMVNYLSNIGFSPVKVTRNDFWYLSPFRKESTASFKVNRQLNRWYDFGEGEGGNLVDFGIKYHNCGVKELLKKILQGLSFQQQNKPNFTEDNEANKIRVINEKEIASFVLLKYLHERKIPLDVAQKFCKEVNYELHGKIYFAIGFKNDADGFELRNEKFKASSSPKEITLIKHNAKQLAVFEGFFNFLSYQTIYHHQLHPKTDFLILNSASFFEKSLSLMQEYNAVNLFLDHDTTGEKCVQKALQLDKKKFFDEREMYKNHNDLNDWLMNFGKSQKQSLQVKP